MRRRRRRRNLHSTTRPTALPRCYPCCPFHFYDCCRCAWPAGSRSGRRKVHGCLLSRSSGCWCSLPRPVCQNLCVLFFTIQWVEGVFSDWRWRGRRVCAKRVEAHGAPSSLESQIRCYGDVYSPHRQLCIGVLHDAYGCVKTPSICRVRRLNLRCLGCAQSSKHTRMEYFHQNAPRGGWQNDGVAVLPATHAVTTCVYFDGSEIGRGVQQHVIPSWVPKMLKASLMHWCRVQ